MWTDTLAGLRCLFLKLVIVLAVNSPIDVTFFSSRHECLYFLNTFPGCFYRFVWPGGSVENLVPGLHRLHQFLPAQVRVSSGGGHHSAHLPWPLPLTVHLLSGMDMHELTVRTARMYFFFYLTWQHRAKSAALPKPTNQFLPFLSRLRVQIFRSCGSLKGYN